MDFFDTLKSLSIQKKLIAAGAVAAVIGGFTLLIEKASAPAMALLYAGVDSATAGEIVSKLDNEGVSYSVDGERIYVEAPARDRLRLTLAREGLPRQAISGYELLDGMSGFSTTSEMFSAAYWRAKEGELARTILAMPGVSGARVHIGADERSPFDRSLDERTASVTVQAPGGLTDSQVKAIQHITALAVSNLRPENVAIADTSLGLLTSTENAPGETITLDERSQASALEAGLVRLLEARVGPGNARASVQVQLSRQREALNEQVIDPNTAVAMTKTRSESRSKEAGADLPVTVASDLPDGDAAGADQSSERVETREDIEYAVSTVDRTIERLPGQIERISVAVLIDNIPSTEEGVEPTPRSAEEMTALRDLVITAIGIDEARGDRVTIQNLPFTRPVFDETELVTEPSLLSKAEPQLWHLGQLGILAVVTLILGLFVVKPILTPNPANESVAALTAELDDTPRDPLDMLRRASTEDPVAAAALLSSWLEEEDAA